MTNYQSPLRDLARKIHELTMQHPAISQALAAVNNLCDHLQAMARCEEINKRDHENRK